jgi:proton-translocating NADH-quinone oxidoreductase chain N
MSIYLFYIEIFLSFIILLQLLINIILVTSRKYNYPILMNEVYFQSTFILLCLISLCYKFKITESFYNFLFFININNTIIKIFILFIVLLSLNFIFEAYLFQKLNFFEFYVFILFFIFSSFLLINTFDLITIYLLLELQGLSFYILASFSRNSAFSSEAGLKYFIFGSIISCFFLLGLSLIYAVSGTLNLNQLASCLNFDNFNSISRAGLLLIFFTLLFKLAVVPFHFWSPDVYEGSPLSATILFTIALKILIVFLIIKISFIAGNSFQFIFDLFKLLGFLSICVGTFFSLKQKRFKRFIIYSSIAQMGFIIVAISSHTVESIIYTYFFIFIYSITSLLIWGYISILYINSFIFSNFKKVFNKSIFITDFSQYFKFNNISAYSFILIFFSIAGIPPLSGFLSKVLILFELIYESNYSLMLAILFISTISMFYYIRVIKINFFEPQKNTFTPLKGHLMTFNIKSLNKLFFILVFSLISLIYIFFFPNFYILYCTYALFF